MNSISFAVVDGIQLSIIQTILLLFFAACIGFWLIDKKKHLLLFRIASVLTFFSLRSISFYKSSQQQKLIVYNVPKHQAIDLVQGRQIKFIGDGALTENDFLRNFHIKPSRTLHRVPISASSITLKSFHSNNKNIIIIDSTVYYKRNIQKRTVDVLVLSKNPRVYVPNLNDAFDIKQIVADASVPAWKVKLWKKDADSLNIPFYDVSEKGAFVMKF